MRIENVHTRIEETLEAIGSIALDLLQDKRKSTSSTSKACLDKEMLEFAERLEALYAERDRAAA